MDTTTLSAAAIIMLALGGLAAWLPARRATKLDLIATLRVE